MDGWMNRQVLGYRIIIIIKLSFIARLNKNNLAQKRVTEKCLIK